MTDFKDISLEFLSGTPAIVVLSLLALLVLTFYQYRRTIPPLARGPRAILISLRALAIIALFFALLEPILSYEIENDRQQRLSLIIDISGSMNANGSGDSRSADVDRFLDSDIYSRIEKTYDVETYFVSESLLTSRPRNSELENPASFTALGDALAELSQKESGHSADVWALLSDGITNSGRPPREITEKLSTPVVTIGVGDAREGLDVSVSDVDFNPIAYVGTETPIRIIVKSSLSGMDNSARATVSLSEDGRPVDSKQIALEPGERSQEVEMSYTPTRPGAHFLEAKVLAGALDVFKSDNSVTFAIKALKSKIKVLMISDRIDWDYKFINRALMSSDRNEVVEVSESKTGAARGKRFPNRQETLNQYDLIVLHNPDPENKSNRYALIESYLRDRGGGVFIFLGDLYLNSKSRNAIEKILPVSIGIRDPEISLPAPAPSQLSPRGDNLLHPGLRIVEEVNQIRSAWAQSPPFTFILPTTNIAEGALVLGETEYNYPAENGSPIPILTARRIGPGKVIALSAAPVWRMGFQSTETQSAELRLMRFVDGNAQWLTALDDLAPVRISPEREVFSRGEKISFRATAYDQGYKPLKGVSGEIALINKDKSDTAFSTLKEIADGRFSAVFEGVTPGTYTYQGKLRHEGAVLKTETGTIEIAPYSLEERRLNPDFAALREIARETSGKYFHLSESAEIGEYFSGEKKSLSMAYDIPLRDNWRLLALFVLALGAEWILRKRYQLL